MKTIKGIFVILFLSLVLAFANFTLNCNRIIFNPPEITFAQADLLPNKLLVVDARPKSEYKIGHIENAVNLPADDFENHLGDFLDVWQPEYAVLVYCQISSAGAGDRVAHKLKNELKIKAVFVFKDDWRKWKEQKR